MQGIFCLIVEVIRPQRGEDRRCPQTHGETRSARKRLIMSIHRSILIKIHGRIAYLSMFAQSSEEEACYIGKTYAAIYDVQRADHVS